MKILVTGAGGFVGKRLTWKLAHGGHQVFALVRAEPGAQDKRYFEGGNVTLVRADLATLDCAALPGGIEAVFTLGQSSYFRDFPTRAEEIYAVNVTANLKILQWARQGGVRRVIHASSGGVYGGMKDVQFKETDLLAVDSPLGFYLGTKLCSEIVLQNYRQFFDTVAILRPFFIYGPGQRGDMFVARIIESVRSGAAVTLQGQDGLRINPIYVDDAVDAFAASLEVPGCSVFNVAGPDVVSLRALADLISKRVGRAPVFKIDAAAQPVDYVGTTAQAGRVLGAARIGLAQGLDLTINPRS